MADHHISGTAVVPSLISSKTMEINEMSKNSGMVQVDMTHPSDRLQYSYYKYSQRILKIGKIHNNILKLVNYNEVASHAGNIF